MIELTVDGKQIRAVEDATILQTCLESGIYIPNLCFIEGMENPPGACRLCFVEVEGQCKLAASCKVRVREGMVVRTDTEPVRKMQRTVFQLLLSAHCMDCKVCPSRKKCPLHQIARFLGVRPGERKMEEIWRDLTVKQAHPCFDLIPSRCILCLKCLYVCRKRNGSPILTVVKKGFDTAIGSLLQGPPESLPCRECMACVEICPVSAILPKEPTKALITVKNSDFK